MKNIGYIINTIKRQSAIRILRSPRICNKFSLSESGRSMVELMGYMAVVIVLISGISKLVARTYNDYKMSKLTMQISDLASVITRASAVDLDYRGSIDNITGLTAEGRKLIPDTFKIKGNSIYHAFNGEITMGCLDVSGTGSTDCSRFYIQFPKLTREQCIELSMKDWRTNSVVDLDSIYINGEQNIWTWPIYAVGDIKELPVVRSAVAGDGTNVGQCGAENDNSNNKWIRWVFN